MRIGPLRHKVNIQSSTNATDGYGEESKTWSTDESIWASIQPLRGTELIEYQQLQTELTHRIIIRYTSYATPAKRITWGSRIFDINVVRNVDERDIYQELLCKEKVMV